MGGDVGGVPTRPGGGPPPGRRRIDRGVAWALGLLVASVPLMLVLLVLVGWAVSLDGTDLSTPAGAERLASANGAYLALGSLAPAGAILLGALAWRRRGRTEGLVIAVLGLIVLVAFLGLPLLVAQR